MAARWRLNSNIFQVSACIEKSKQNIRKYYQDLKITKTGSLAIMLSSISPRWHVYSPLASDLHPPNANAKVSSLLDGLPLAKI